MKKSPKKLNQFIYLLPEKALELGLIDKIDEKFNEKRKIGQNDDLLCQIIREDQIDLFISYVNQHSYPLNSFIKRSIFETNSFLIKCQKTSLIEYAVFFGSVQIFKYLYKNEVNLTPSLWLYAVHGINQEIIQILEDNKITPKDYTYKECYKESIKCHHNDLIYYIECNYLKEKEEDFFENNVLSFSFRYYNFIYFPTKIRDDFIFNYSCMFDYFKIVEYFIKRKNNNLITTNIISNNYYCLNNIFYFFLNDFTPFKCAANYNNQEIIVLLLKDFNSIEPYMFQKCKKMKYIYIPSFITTIEENAFGGCSSLIEINIPSSVTTIKKFAFSKCISLTNIIIPSSLTSIEDNVFGGCSSLTEITIPSSVTKIGNFSFSKCTSLTEITIPNSVKIIGNFAFYLCSSLKNIVIPSSVTSIGTSCFMDCCSLTEFSIPSSLTALGINLFNK